MRVLIIEDEEKTADYLHRGLTEQGYTVDLPASVVDIIFADNSVPDRFEQAGERVLIKGEHFTAYVPFAGRWPIEIHVLPHRHVQNLAQLDDAERDELASIYSRLLKALDTVYDTPTPYISAWHQAPLIEGGEDVRLQLQITSPRRAKDKLKFLAGSESAMGAFIGDVQPEVTAAQIREILQ